MTSPNLFSRLSTALVRHTPRGPAAAEPRLRAALDQVVSHPGKLLRSALVLRAAEQHGLAPADAERLAAAVEYFHAASLLLDDLPCMDDAVTRRGQMCVHRRHGEATAILAALALINRAYALIGTALAAQPRRVRSEATRCLDHHLGIAGLVGGQAWDLAFGSTDQSARAVGRIAAAKTGALFALAVLLPAVLAKPTQREWRRLRALCVYWSQLFQIGDDLRDVLATSVEVGKTTGRDRLLVRPNLALAIGVPAARARQARLQEQACRALEDLGRVRHGRWAYLGEVHALLVQPDAEALVPQTAAA